MNKTTQTTHSAHLKDATWEKGLRPYFQYRDLGIQKITDGRMLAQVNQAVLPCKGPGGYHSHTLDFQMCYVLKGWMRVYFDDVGEVRYETGDAWYQPPSVKHDVLEYSDDLEVLEITMPADFPTMDEGARP